jgi:RNA polymerase primary sigma factor
VDPTGGRARAGRQGANRPAAGARGREAEQHRPPSSEEIAEVVELPAEEVEQIRRAARAPVSLAKPVGEEGDVELGDLLHDDGKQLPHEQIELIQRNEALRRLLDRLTSRERQIIELRYGLNGRPPATLDQLGLTFGITRERIRQIESKCLIKLKALAEADSLTA